MAEITAEIQASAAVNAEIDCFPIRYVDCEDFEDTVADAVTDYLDENPPAGVDRYNKTEIDAKLDGKLDTTDYIYSDDGKKLDVNSLAATGQIYAQGKITSGNDVLAGTTSLTETAEALAGKLDKTDDIYESSNGKTLNADKLAANQIMAATKFVTTAGDYEIGLNGEISLKKTTTSVSELKSDLVHLKSQRVVYQPKATYKDKNGNDIREFYLSAVLDLEMYGADENEKYSFGAFVRNSTQVDITIWNSSYTIVCEYLVTETGATGKKLVPFTSKNSSGITAKAIIDFDKFVVGTNYVSLVYNYCGIDTHCYVKSIRENDIKINNYKKKGIFDDNATLVDRNNNDISSFLTSVIKDIYITGASINETYAIGQISRNSSNVVQINIWNSAYTDVLTVYIADASSYSGIKTLDLSALNSSGMGGKITVDFDVFTVGTYYPAIPLKSTKIASNYIFGSLREQTFAEKTNIPTRRWENKKWYAIGDSFTEQNIYPYYLNEYCKFSEYYNAGWSGHCMGDMVTKITAKSTSGYDIITVLCGTNDYGAGTTLGTINDAKTVNSFYGHTKNLIETIIGQNPKARLCFFTPTIRGAYESQPVYPAKNSAGVGLDEYVDAIKEVCEIYAIPCCDTFRTSQFNLLTLSTLTQDNLHPNYDGGKLLARQMQGFIESY